MNECVNKLGASVRQGRSSAHKRSKNFSTQHQTARIVLTNFRIAAETRIKMMKIAIKTLYACKTVCAELDCVLKTRCFSQKNEEGVDACIGQQSIKKDERVKKTQQNTQRQQSNTNEKRHTKNRKNECVSYAKSYRNKTATTENKLSTKVLFIFGSTLTECLVLCI